MPRNLFIYSILVLSVTMTESAYAFLSLVRQGAESAEVPNANDFVMKSIGPQEIIMTRSRDGKINLLQNRCPHRGNQLCAEAKGNKGIFTCPYHRWAFTNTGDLRGYPYPDGYETADRSELGLGKVTRVA